MVCKRTALLGFVVAAAVGGAAWAQGDSGGQQISSFQLMTGTVLVVRPDGTVTRRPDLPADTLTELTREARPMPVGTILFMRDHTLYAAPDRRMQSGTMLSQVVAEAGGR